jgi:hypothetical protein
MKLGIEQMAIDVASLGSLVPAFEVIDDSFPSRRLLKPW